MRFPHAALVLVGFVIAGCQGGVTEPSPSKSVTETFTGTIVAYRDVGDYLGFDTKMFTVGQTGEYSVTLNSVTPPLPANYLVQLSVRQADPRLTGGCGSAINVGVVQTSGTGQPTLAGTIGPGTYCVRIFDVDVRFRDDETYSLTVSHP